MKEWKKKIGNKLVNEIVFLGFDMVGVYEVGYLGEVIVVKCMELWCG